MSPSGPARIASTAKPATGSSRSDRPTLCCNGASPFKVLSASEVRLKGPRHLGVEARHDTRVSLRRLQVLQKT